MEIRDSSEPVNERDVAAFEKELGCTLPEEYRTFLLKHNGGVPSRSVFNYCEHGERLGSVVEYFLSLGTGTNTLDWNRDIYSKRIPDDLLPIATTTFGNKVCIGVKGKKRGRMYIWDHELEGTRGAVMPVECEGFTDFLAKLKPMPVEPVSELEKVFIDGDVGRLKAILDGGMAADGGKPLRAVILAVRNDRLEMLDLLLSRGARTTGLLDEAARLGRVQIIRLLIKKYGVDPDAIEELQMIEDSENVKSIPSFTALTQAVVSNHSEAVRVLLELGANSQAESKYGMPMRYWTTENPPDDSMRKIIALLDEADAKREKKKDGQ